MSAPGRRSRSPRAARARPARACRAVARLAALVLSLAVTAACTTGGDPAQDAHNFEGNWSAVFVVTSTDGALVDQSCRPLAVGEQLRPVVAIIQDENRIVFTIVPTGTWPAVQLSGRVQEDEFDGMGEMATACGGPLRLGLRGESVDERTISGEIVATRGTLAGRMSFSAARL